MPNDQIGSLIGLIGIALQLAGSGMVAGLFWLLRRSQSRRVYFGLWTESWIALSLAIAALFLRFIIAPGLGRAQADASLEVHFYYFAYDTAKLMFYVLIVAGAAAFARGVKLRMMIAASAVGSAVYAMVAVTISSSLNGVVALQAPVAVLCLAVAAYLLLSIPTSRRSLGSHATGAVLAFSALVEAYYFVAFRQAVTAAAMGHATDIPRIVSFNAYIDLLLHFSLSFGMLLMLMEDAKREADDAHAELAVAHNQLRRSALFDPLTGALNRRGFVEGVGLEHARAAYGAVMMLDMDNLKTVNDSYGHPAGDELLRRLAEVLRASLRPSDRLYRWGGDEFLLVLPGAAAADMQPRVEALLAEAEMIPTGATERLKLLVSVGAAEYTGAEELEAAIVDADAAMYRQKQQRKVRPADGIQLELGPVMS